MERDYALCKYEYNTPQPKTINELLDRLASALQDAKDHLEYCGYGDNWERECSEGLDIKIQDALNYYYDFTEIDQDENKFLKPCPFCGEIPNLKFFDGDGGWYIICSNTQCTVRPITRGLLSKEQAVTYWETRKEN